MARLKVVGAEADLFSYAALSREDEVAAKADAEVINAHMRSAAESIISVGLALTRQKGRLPHGIFLPSDRKATATAKAAICFGQLSGQWHQ